MWTPIRSHLSCSFSPINVSSFLDLVAVNILKFLYLLAFLKQWSHLMLQLLPLKSSPSHQVRWMLMTGKLLPFPIISRSLKLWKVDWLLEALNLHLDQVGNPSRELVVTMTLQVLLSLLSRLIKLLKSILGWWMFIL